MKKAPTNRACKGSRKEYFSDIKNKHNRELLESFLRTHETKKGRKLSKKGLGSYIYPLRDLGKFFEDKNLEDIRAIDLKEFIEYLRTRNLLKKRRDHKKLKESTISKTKAIIRALFRWLYETNEWDLKNSPAINLKIGVHRTDTVFLSLEERDKILECAKERGYRDYAMLFTGFETGLRPSELLDLSLTPTPDSNYITEKGVIVVNKAKGMKKRTFKIPNWKALEPILNEYVEKHRLPPTKHKKYNPVFTTREGSKPCYEVLKRALRRAVIAAGIDRLEFCPEHDWQDITPHILRKTFGSWYAYATKDVLSLKNIMGHSKLETTMIYMGLIADFIDNKDQDLDIYQNPNTKSGLDEALIQNEPQHIRQSENKEPEHVPVHVQERKQGWDIAYL